MHNAEYLTTAQVAEQLGCNVATVNRYVRHGRLKPSMQFPGLKGARMYHPAEVERFAATLEVTS
jgi:excisionase family DNA binding protein